MVEPSLPLELAIAKRASTSLSPSRLRAFSYTLARLYLLKIFGVLCCVCVELVLVQKSCCVFGALESDLRINGSGVNR